MLHVDVNSVFQLLFSFIQVFFYYLVFLNVYKFLDCEERVQSSSKYVGALSENTK